MLLGVFTLCSLLGRDAGGVDSTSIPLFMSDVFLVPNNERISDVGAAAVTSVP